MATRTSAFSDDPIHHRARAWAVREVRASATSATILTPADIRALAGAAYEAGYRAAVADQGDSESLESLLERSISLAKARKV
jgi:hypothetical protein